ncbi:hypothetical protein AAHC03_019064 [Spirometra sp. Aus1]
MQHDVPQRIKRAVRDSLQTGSWRGAWLMDFSVQNPINAATLPSTHAYISGCEHDQIRSRRRLPPPTKMRMIILTLLAVAVVAMAQE